MVTLITLLPKQVINFKKFGGSVISLNGTDLHVLVVNTSRFVFVVPYLITNLYQQTRNI